MKINLFFGSFNPVHIGHLILANAILQNSDQEEVWMVCTPHNPDKPKNTLLNEQDRLEMLHLATQNIADIRPCDIEFFLPKPSYTAHTLVYLEEKYPQHQFSILLGEDNLQTLPTWENADYILDKFPIFVYPRNFNPKKELELPKGNIQFLKDLPLLAISASMIRHWIKTKKNIQFLVTKPVQDYIEKKGLYL